MSSATYALVLLSPGLRRRKTKFCLTQLSVMAGAAFIILTATKILTEETLDSTKTFKNRSNSSRRLPKAVKELYFSYVHARRQESSRHMFELFANTWRWKLGNIGSLEHRTSLTKCSRPSCSTTCWLGHKTRKLRKQNHLKSWMLI